MKGQLGLLREIRFGLLAIVFLSANLLGQGGASNSQSKDTGNKADQNLKSIARVNPSTLAMEMSIPLASYPGRNGNALPVGMSYSSKVWRMKSSATYWYPLLYSRQYVTQLIPFFAEKSVAGWTSSINFPVIEEKFDIYDEEGEVFNLGLDEAQFNSSVQSAITQANGGATPENLSVCGAYCSGGWTQVCYNGECTPWGCGGWSLSYCDLGGTWDAPEPGGGGTPPPPPRMHYIKRVHVKIGESTHEFRKSDAKFGYCAGSGQSDGPNCEGTQFGFTDNYGMFLSVDGSGMKLDRTQNGSTLYLPNGSRYLFPATASGGDEGVTHYQATGYVDVDGNRSVFSETTTENNLVRKVKDTLGREITDFLPKNFIEQEQKEGIQTIDFPGLSGQQHYEAKWLHLKPVPCEGSANTNCGATEGALENQNETLYFYTSNACFGNVYPPTNPSNPNEKLFPANGFGLRSCNPFTGSTPSTAVPTRFNPVVLAEVKLPNGKTYEFKYNQYGEITKIKYPTGSVETFVYGRITPVSGFSEMAYDQTNRGVTERRVYKTDGTLEQRWRYSAVFDAATGSYKVTTIAPKGNDPLGDGIKTEKFLRSDHAQDRIFGFESPVNGMPFEERTYDENGVIRSRTLTEYTVKGPVPTNDPLRPAETSAQRDPRVSRSISIIYNPPTTGSQPSLPDPGDGDDGGGCQGGCGGGTPTIPGDVLATLTKTEYDETENSNPEHFLHLNAKVSKNYNYAVIPATVGLTANIQTIAGYFDESKLANISETDYSYDAGYKARGINSLPTESRVKDKNGVLLAKTQPVFDEPSRLVPDSGSLGGDLAATWVSPNTTLRGKVTTSKVWNLDTSSWIETHTQFDQYGNVRKVWDPIGNMTETEYSADYAFAYPTKVITPAPDPDNSGHGTNEGSFATTTYDPITGLQLTVTNEFGQTTKTEYNDALLRPTKVYGLGDFVIPISETIYDDTNLTVKARKQIDADNWDEATTFMDGFGRAFKTQAKDSQGDVFVETKYDNLGRVERVTNPYRIGDTVYWSKTRYDELGRAVESYAPATLADITANNLTSLGVTSFDISTVPNFIGTVVTTTDASMRKGRSITNALGQLLRVDEPTGISTDANADLGALATPNQPTFYKYDQFGKMVEVTQGVQKRWFKYDSLGRLLRVRQPEQEINTALNLADSFNTSGQWTAGFTYDILGNVLTATDAKGTVITNTYDRANRVKTRTYSNEPAGVTTPAVNFYYDSKGLAAPQTPNFAKGKLTKVDNGISATEYMTFDNFGRLTRSKQITDGVVYGTDANPMTYSYNLSGALTEEKYPSGRVVKNDFEPDGDLLNVTSRKTGTDVFRPYVSNFSYTAAGGISQMRLGNGKWETAKFNNRLQVTELGLGASAANAGLWKVNYDYGELNTDGTVNTTKNTGNIAKQTLTIPGTSFVQGYKYDSLYRLTEAKETTGTNQNWIQNWTYDQFGNRISFAQNINGSVLNTTPAISQTTNRFTNLTDFGYDANGNIITDRDPATSQTRQFVFNGDNKQKEVISNGVSVGKYFYDGEGKRVKKQTATETTVFVYSSGKLIAEYSTQLSQNPTISYTTTDHLGSPRIITDQFGQVKSRRDFLPFGEDMPVTFGARSTNQEYANGDQVRQKFTGYLKDNETGLDFAEARMYETRHGRFTAVDPLLASGKSANPQTFNRYVYVGNNPVLRTDPDGEDWHVGWEKIKGRWYTVPQWFDGRGRGPKWGSIWKSGNNTYSTSFVFRDALTGKYNAYDPYSKDKALDLTQDGAEAAFNGFLNRAVQNYVVGAADNISLTFWLGRKALGLEVNEDHDTYRVGSGQGLASSIVMAPVGGLGLVNLTVSRGSKLIVASSKAGDILPMSLVRIIEKGQSVDELANEAKALTWSSGNEHALVTLSGGQRALVSGGPGGIFFENGQIKRIWAHTHPDPSNPSVADGLILQTLGNSQQTVFNVGNGNVTKVRRRR